MTALTMTPKLQFFDNNGYPLSGGKLYTYSSGTSTPKDTYIDAAGATPNANPVIMDSRGECVVRLGSGAYRFTLKDSSDVTLWGPIDDITSVESVLSGATGADSIGYTRGSADSVTQTVQDRLRGIGVCVFEFMTESEIADVTSLTGSVDVTTAIQNALDYISGIGGGSIFFPQGVYRLTTELTYDANDLLIHGEGPYTSQFMPVNGTQHGFVFGNGTTARSEIWVRDVGFQSPITKTAGAAFRFRKIQHGGVDKFYSVTQFSTIDLEDCAIINVDNGQIANPTATTGRGIYIFGGNDHYLRNTIVTGNAAGEPNSGFHIQRTAATWLDNCGALDAGIGLKLLAESGDTIEHVFSSRCAWDGCSSHGALIQANSGGIIRRSKFVQDWSGTNTGDGVIITGAGDIDDLEFIGHRAYNNQLHGFLCNSGNNIRILGGTFSGNSGASSNTYDGIQFDNIDGFSIIGATSGAVAGFTNIQRYGINIVNAASTNFVVKDNNVLNNTTAGLATAASTSVVKIIRDNVGYVGYKEAVVTDTTDGSGDITITHGMATTPTYIRIQMTGAASVAVWQAHTIGATTFKIRFWSVVSGPGAALTGTSVTVNWEASI